MSNCFFYFSDAFELKQYKLQWSLSVSMFYNIPKAVPFKWYIFNLHNCAISHKSERVKWLKIVFTRPWMEMLVHHRVTLDNNYLYHVVEKGVMRVVYLTLIIRLRYTHWKEYRMIESETCWDVCLKISEIQTNRWAYFSPLTLSQRPGTLDNLNIIHHPG